MKNQVFTIILIITILISFLSGCISSNGDNNNDNNTDWTPAPDFSLKTLQGQTIMLSDYKGHVVLLDMMGVDCPFCVYVMPVLKEISENYTDLIIISIDVYQYETESYLQSFIDVFDSQLNIKLDWIFGMDSDGSISKKYNVEGVPQLILVNKNGNAYYFEPGYTDYLTIAKMLDNIAW